MKQSLFKLLHRFGLHHALRYHKSGNKFVTILCLHRISNEFSLAFPSISINDFKLLLEYLSKHYEVVQLKGLPKIKSSKPALVLSFDDGFLDFYENALPLLQQFNLPCNLNVVINCLDNNFQIWTQ